MYIMTFRKSCVILYCYINTSQYYCSYLEFLVLLSTLLRYHFKCYSLYGHRKEWVFQWSYSINNWFHLCERGIPMPLTNEAKLFLWRFSPNINWLRQKSLNWCMENVIELSHSKSCCDLEIRFRKFMKIIPNVRNLFSNREIL